MEIPGEGQFVVARHTKPGYWFFRNPIPQGGDLKLPPWSGVVIESSWLTVPHFVRAVQTGEVTLERTDTVPEPVKATIAPEYEADVDEFGRHFVIQLCGNELTEQAKDAINVGDLIGVHGVPRKGVRVTVEFLKQKHLPMLRAARELEGRWQKRPEVKRLLKKAIDKIEAM